MCFDEDHFCGLMRLDLKEQARDWLGSQSGLVIDRGSLHVPAVRTDRHRGDYGAAGVERKGDYQAWPSFLLVHTLKV